MFNLSLTLATLHYMGYVAYTKLAHGPELETQSMYQQSIFMKGTSISLPCDGIRQLLFINEAIGHSIWLEKVKLTDEFENNDYVTGFSTSISLIWLEQADNFENLTNHEVVSLTYCAAPIIHSLSTVNFCRQTKATSFSSYELHNLELWTLVRGNVLDKIQNILKGINTEPIEPIEWQTLSAFMDMFFVELSRNPTTLIYLPMCFDIYNHLTDDRHMNDLKQFIINNHLLLDATNNDILRCILTEYFPMSMKGAMHVSMHFSKIAEQILKNNNLDQYYYSYDFRKPEPSSCTYINKFIASEKRLIKAYHTFIDQFDIKQISSFAESIHSLLVRWYNVDDDLRSEAIVQNGTMTIWNLAGDIYEPYADYP